jgi:hypothetical protein
MQDNSPFVQKNTISYRVFEMAVKGTSIDAINKFVIRKGSDVRGAGRLIRILRREELNGKRWQYKEERGKIKVIPIEEKKSRKRRK